MKALVKIQAGSGKETIKYMDVPEPMPEANEIKIKVLACGICGTDIHIMMDEYVNYPPVILGHEYIGIVCDKGESVEDFAVGDYVVSLTAIRTCGKCTYCHQDLRMLCNNRKSIGCIVNGAMAEYIVIPADVAFKIPRDIPDKTILAISEPAVCVVRAVIEKSFVKGGDVVVVSGPGTIGQLAAQVAKIMGAYVVIVGLPSDKARLELALELGADAAVNNEADLKRILHEVSPDGADVVLECAGSEGSARTCLEVVKKTGIFTQIGLFGKPIKFNFDQMVFKEVTMTTSIATERTSWQTYLRLIQNQRFNLAPLISKRLPLQDWEKGFDSFLNNEGYKIVLIP